MEKEMIACRIFEDELKAVLDKNESLKIHWIEAALHADPVKMESAISQALSKKVSPESGICFLFGNGCHPDMPHLCSEMLQGRGQISGEGSYTTLARRVRRYDTDIVRHALPLRVCCGYW